MVAPTHPILFNHGSSMPANTQNPAGRHARNTGHPTAENATATTSPHSIQQLAEDQKNGNDSYYIFDFSNLLIKLF